MTINVYRFRQLLLIFAVLLTSCGTVRRGTVPDEVVLSVGEQRKYEYYFLEALSLEQQERYDEAFYFPQAPVNVLANVTVNF